MKILIFVFGLCLLACAVLTLADEPENVSMRSLSDLQYYMNKLKGKEQWVELFRGKLQERGLDPFTQYSSREILDWDYTEGFFWAGGEVNEEDEEERQTRDGAERSCETHDEMALKDLIDNYRYSNVSNLLLPLQSNCYFVELARLSCEMDRYVPMELFFPIKYLLVVRRRGCPVPYDEVFGEGFGDSILDEWLDGLGATVIENPDYIRIHVGSAQLFPTSLGRCWNVMFEGRCIS
ncbi:hypothetical protein QOT17_022733 [Balamuthia mandrillaris]